MSKNDVVILAGCRTAIGTFGGAFKDVPATELGAVVVREAVKRAGLRPDQVDEVILGCILQAGQGMNPARQAAIKAGLPESVPAHTVNKVCGSGLKAVMLAAQAVRCGDAEIVVAGGIENMSRAPFLLPGARWGERLGHGRLLDHMIHEGLTDAFHDIHMGVTAENLVERYGIRREDQDAFAAESQSRAAAAIREGRFKAEIVPVPVPQKGGESKPVDTDELIARIRMILKRNKQVLDTNPLSKLPGNPSIQARVAGSRGRPAERSTSPTRWGAMSGPPGAASLRIINNDFSSSFFFKPGRLSGFMGSLPFMRQ
jgi:acetyl-CoA acetyltransferase family protein